MNTIDILSIHDIIIKDHQNSEDDMEKENDKWKSLYKEIYEKTSDDVLMDLKEKFILDEKKIIENFNFYLVSSVSIIDEFIETKKNIQKISFFKMNNSTSNQNKKKIQDIIDKYIQLVDYYFPGKYNNYWTLENDKYQKRKKIHISSIKECPTCNGDNEQFVIADNHIVCSFCGTVISTTNDNLISFRDIERINIGSKYTYDRKTHFRECIKRFQGKQNVNIPPKLFDDIIQQIISYQLIPKNFDNFEKKEVFKNVKREHIQMILKDLGYSKYYEDIVYIYHKITGHEIPDITHLENNLINDFDLLLECYDATFKTERKNFINNQYVLYQLLRKYKYNCRKEDFQFLKTNDRKYYHDVVCQQLFEKLGWNFNAVF
jgi:hypothetical protein